MAGILYKLIKKYEDRFIYTIIKWNSKYYSPTSSSNKVSIVVDDISNFSVLSAENGWDKENSPSDDQVMVDEFWQIFTARFQMGKIERNDFIAILDSLEVGQGINELKKAYKIARNMILDRPKNERIAQKRLLDKERQFKKLLEEKEKEQRKQQREEEKQKQLEELHLQIKRDKELRKIREKEREEKRRLQAKQKEHQMRMKERITGMKYDVFRALIHEPVFGRYHDSSQTYFDYIEVDVSFTMLVFDQDIKPMVSCYKDRITLDVLESNRNNKEFKKYGIPINFLRIDRVSLNETSRELHYLFVLKELHK